MMRRSVKIQIPASNPIPLGRDSSMSAHGLESSVIVTGGDVLEVAHTGERLSCENC